MAFNHDYFNAHANQNRVMGNKATNSLGVVHQYNAPPPVTKKDETAYSRAMEKAAMGKRKVTVSLAATPW